MAQNLQTFNDILKEYYLGPIRSTLNNSSILLARIEPDQENISGKEGIVPIHVGRNEGIGARPDGGSLPSPQRQRYRRVRVPMKFNYGSVKITGPTIAASRDDPGAFGRAVDEELVGVTRDLRRDVNRQLFSDGTGLLARVSDASGTADTDVAVDNTQYLAIGMIVDVLKVADGSLVSGGDGREIVDIDEESGIVELDEPVDTTTEHGLYRTGNYGNEITGLDVLIDDEGTVHTIDRSETPSYRANVLMAPNGFLSIPLMQRAIDAAEKRASGIISLIITSYAGRRAYTSRLQSQRRYVNTMVLDGGFEAVEFNNRPVVPDPQCQDDRMYFLDEPTLKLLRMSDWDWMDRDGSILQRVSGQDAYEATLFLYAELACTVPSRNARIEGIDEDAVSPVEDTDNGGGEGEV